MKTIISLLAVLLFASHELVAQPEKSSTLPVPPPMPKRVIAPPTVAFPGQTNIINDAWTNFTLFIPNNFKAPASGEFTLTVHFHSGVWFAIEEHLRRGLTNPMIAAHLGEGSTTYRLPFEDRERFGRWIKLAEEKVSEHSGKKGAKVSAVNISSFSAGYGAVREIVKSAEYQKIIQRIVLCDSMYASFEQGSTNRPAAEHIQPWIPFALAAARGEKTFVMTYSQVPTGTYANSAQCALAVIEAVGARLNQVGAGEIPATSDPDFPLLTRSDLNHFHAWGYGGKDAQAHMTHPRHLADVWLVLDKARAP